MDYLNYRRYDRETNQVKYDVSGGFLPRGQDFVSIGKPVNLAVNSYNVTAFPTAKVYQYAVSQTNLILANLD